MVLPILATTNIEECMRDAGSALEVIGNIQYIKNVRHILMKFHWEFSENYLGYFLYLGNKGTCKSFSNT